MYHLELKLSRIALVTLAKAFWDIPEIKHRVRCYWLETYGPWYWYRDVMEYIFQLATPLFDKLPTTLKLDLEEMIVFLGDEMWYWIIYCREKICPDLNFRFDLDFYKVAYFSPFGSIDESQIFNKHWIQNGTSVERDLILFTACKLCEEEFISESKNEIIDLIKRLLTSSGRIPVAEAEKLSSKVRAQLESDVDVVFVLLANWLDAFTYAHPTYTRRQLHREQVPLQTGMFTSPTKENCDFMCSMCFRLRYARLFKYFYGKWPNRTDDDANAFLSLYFGRNDNNFFGEKVARYEVRKQFEMILTVLNEMSKPQLTMYSKNEWFLTTAMEHWPYQELFLQNFDNDVYTDSWSLLHRLCGLDRYDYDCKSTVFRNTYRTMLKAVLQQIYQDHNVRRFISSRDFNFYFISQNYRTLKVIFNFSSPYFDDFVHKIHELMKRDEFSKVNRFLETVLEDNEESGLFLEVLKVYLTDYFLNSANYEKAEKCFNCLVKYGMRVD